MVQTLLSSRSSSSTQVGEASCGLIETHELDVSVSAIAHFLLSQL